MKITYFKKSSIMRSIYGLSIIGLLLLASCEKYEEYIYDYDYSSVCFGSQKPLRTVVARADSATMQFKFGISLGGLRENNSDVTAKFTIDTMMFSKIKGGNIYKLLPREYYTLGLPASGDSIITVPKGKFIGDIAVRINKALFTADTLSLLNTYALPIRLTETSADSILTSTDSTLRKDFTIIVVRYIDEKSGTYYVKGTQDSVGKVTSYNIADLIKNKTRTLTTLSTTKLNMDGLGAFNPSATEKLVINFNGSSVTCSQAVGGDVITDLGSSYDVANRTINIKYSFVKGAVTYTADEHLILRQDPELDLRFEEW